MWNIRLGYLLHPEIPLEHNGNTELRIADVGAGNAIWLLELARHLSPSAELQGFDISADQFPAKEWLPPNISLYTWDAFGEVPSHMYGLFDIVHLRTFTVVIKGGNPAHLLGNLVKILSASFLLQVLGEGRFEELQWIRTFWLLLIGRCLHRTGRIHPMG
ncbi:MAG: hypothetical protein Q9187_003784 [Circinaria calcarea]